MMCCGGFLSSLVCLVSCVLLVCVWACFSLLLGSFLLWPCWISAITLSWHSFSSNMPVIWRFDLYMVSTFLYVHYLCFYFHIIFNLDHILYVTSVLICYLLLDHEKISLSFNYDNFARYNSLAWHCSLSALEIHHFKPSWIDHEISIIVQKNLFKCYLVYLVAFNILCSVFLVF